jgi:DNA polymerase
MKRARNLPAVAGRTKAARKPATLSQRAERLARLAEQIRICVRCPLHESRTHAVPGDGRPGAQVMVIGEAPGGDEDRRGHPFIGASGRFLNQVLQEAGIDRDELFITNIVKCRPPGNRVPRKLEVDTCTSNYLFEQIELVNPKLIVLLGGVAVKKLLGAKSVNDVRGRVIEHGGRKFFVTYHPAVRFHREDLAEIVRQDFAAFRRELKKL